MSTAGREADVDRIAANLNRVREQIASAAERAGRSPDEVTLVGVSKYVDAAMTRLLVEAGLNTLGEARPQQLWDKAASPELADAVPPGGKPIEWRLIGHLQRNKVRRTLPLVASIDSVDSERLLQAISRESAPDRRTDVLLEVNISGDPAKHGLTADEARGLVMRLSEFPGVRVCGLIGMAAREGGETVARRNFHALRDLRDGLESEGALLPVLSMGMSGDFEAAIAEGSTLVRIGSALWEGIKRD